MKQHTSIRPECLRPAATWVKPTGDEIKEVVKLAGLSGATAAEALGLGKGGGRTVRRWIGEDTSIPYAAWGGVLCELAGLGTIWKNTD
jgi:hypothetical protein